MNKNAKPAGTSPTKTQKKKTSSRKPTAKSSSKKQSIDEISSTSENDKSKPVRVVAIGASAGGLEPIEQFFAKMPANSGMAFVIVQHLSPDFRSMMDQLLARQSKMKIVQAEDGMEVAPNVIYLNPPRTELGIVDGRLTSREYSELELVGFPIDSFFGSLAEDQKRDAICIIMSGTGSDGTRGSIEVTTLGGTVIAQEPTSAKFDSMPRSTIGSNPEVISAFASDMPALLAKIISGAPIEEVQDSVNFVDKDPTAQILNMLDARFGADFNHYKPTTVGRRIRRRALLNQIPSVEQYKVFLEENKSELEVLYFDLLIGVTSFFRDTEAFETMAERALPLVANKMSAKRQLRVWVPGCASGEEAYSLIMLIAEYAEQNEIELNLRVFATDIQYQAIEIANQGIYDATSVKNIPPELLEKYFDPFDGRYQVKQKYRKLVVFSSLNLAKDPPLTRMDIVSCRNLLIYFDDAAQKKFLAFFHFSLNKEGILFLGSSESVNDLENEFETISKKWRIFQKRRDVKLREAASLLRLTEPGSKSSKTDGLQEARVGSLQGRMSVTDRQILTRAYDRMLEKYAPASLLITTDGELIHVFGEGKKYLEFSQGLFTTKVTDLIHPDLRLVVNAGIERVLASQSLAFRRSTKLALDDNDPVELQIMVEYIDNLSRDRGHILITLEEKKPNPLESGNFLATNVNETDANLYLQRISELEFELKTTEESLQTTVEELETSNEELQATNEELMASNEELQSTNEELHSVNEELYTVSAEHQRKIEELTELNTDMTNLFRVTEVGTIFLDNSLKIRRFTPAAAETFNLVAHDIGRPIEHITFKFDLDSLQDDLRRVRDRGRSIQHEISVGSDTYMLRVFPYASENLAQSGVVLTVVNVTELKHTQRELVEQQRLVSSVVEQQKDIILRFGPDLNITFVNPAFRNYYLKSDDALLGTNFIELVQKNQQRKVKREISKLKVGGDCEYICEDTDTKGIKHWLQWNLHSIVGDDGQTTEIQGVGRDVTEVVQARRNLEQLNDKIAFEQRRLSKIYRLTPVMLHSVSREGKIVEVSDYWCEQMGYSREQVLGQDIVEFIERKIDEKPKELFENLFAGEVQDNILIQMKKANGEIMDARLSSIIAPGSDDGTLHSFTVVFDVTDQLRAETELASQNEELTRINENLNQFTNIVSHDLTGPLRAIKHTSEWIEEDASEEAREKIQDHIDRMKDQILKMSSMLNDLLDYSKAGSTELPTESIELRDELEGIFDVTDNPNQLDLIITALPDNIKTYRAPLNLVLRNLIENAIKYNDDKGNKVIVSAEDLGDFWQFNVTDDGPGIHPDMHDKILLPFRKLERRDQIAGNGMGLALVKKAVEANGGILQIHSNPEKERGTTFSFSWKKNGSS